MITLVVDWNSVWAMTGIGIGVVFCILLLLVFVLILFGTVFGGKSTPKAVAKPVAVQAADTGKTPALAASQETEAAIATSLYLYFQDVHDEESYKLTIHHEAHPAWHSELNHHLTND